jgi:hypothetical protein
MSQQGGNKQKSFSRTSNVLICCFPKHIFLTQKSPKIRLSLLGTIRLGAPLVRLLLRAVRAPLAPLLQVALLRRQGLPRLPLPLPALRRRPLRVPQLLKQIELKFFATRVHPRQIWIRFKCLYHLTEKFKCLILNKFEFFEKRAHILKSILFKKKHSSWIISCYKVTHFFTK